MVLGFETLDLQFCELKLWELTVSDHTPPVGHACPAPRV